MDLENNSGASHIGDMNKSSMLGWRRSQIGILQCNGMQNRISRICRLWRPGNKLPMKKEHRLALGLKQGRLWSIEMNIFDVVLAIASDGSSLPCRHAYQMMGSGRSRDLGEMASYAYLGH